MVRSRRWAMRINCAAISCAMPTIVRCTRFFWMCAMRLRIFLITRRSLICSSVRAQVQPRRSIVQRNREFHRPHRTELPCTDDFLCLIYRREPDFDYELAKLLILVKELKLFGRSKRCELQVVPLVGNLKILQGLVFLPQSSVGESQAKA